MENLLKNFSGVNIIRLVHFYENILFYNCVCYIYFVILKIIYYFMNA